MSKHTPIMAGIDNAVGKAVYEAAPKDGTRFLSKIGGSWYSTRFEVDGDWVWAFHDDDGAINRVRWDALQEWAPIDIAPEMLEVLKGVRVNLVRLAWEENTLMIEGLDAAIAKAEGRT